MYNEQVEAKVFDLWANQVGLEVDDVEFHNVLSDHADSLDVIEFTIDLEEEFNIAIPDEDTDNWRTIGDAIKYIEESIDD